MNKRKAKVFISCGQRENEKLIAEKVKNFLDKLGYSPYLACNIMSLDPITIVTKELTSSDYYIFIDFKRISKNEGDLPISLFTHQELALAHHLGFKDEIIALREMGVPEKHGIIWYVLSNAEYFQDESELLYKLDELIKRKNWSPDFSRNLVVNEINIIGPFNYSDHTGNYFQKVAEVKVENRRPDIAAVDTVVILNKIIEANGNEVSLHDRTYLKWSGQKGYHNTILPNDFRNIAAFSINYSKPGIFLNSAQDISPKSPIIDDDGIYLLCYKVFSQNLPLLSFKIQLNLQWKDIDGRRLLESETTKIINYFD